MSDLLYRIQFKHDQLAFKEFYEIKVVRLFQFAMAFVKNREIAEEIVNDTFLKLWNKRCELDSIGNIDVYLYVAVKNASLNVLRRHVHKHIAISEIEPEHLYVHVNPESAMVTSELQRIIEKAINTLPPRCRMVFKLIKEDKLSYKQVAAILNISTKTVDTQLGIALKKLEGILCPFLNQPSATS